MKNIYDQNYYYSYAIDLTNKCNGGCKFCPRNNNFSSHLKTLGEFDFDLFKRIFDDYYINHITNLVLNGNLGDPSLYSKMFELLDYVNEHNNKVKMFISTNGSARSEIWWKTLAEKMAFGRWNAVVFTVDGLEDTHHRYRGTDYNKVLRNMNTFINAGGNAKWQYIVFEYNQHQLEEAKRIAKDIGCTEFIKVISRRYDWEFKRPTNLEAKTKNELCSTASPNRIFCTPIENRHLYISHDGFLFPCCDYGLFEDFRTREKYPAKMYIEYLKSLELLDLSKSTINDALNSPFFKYVFENKGDLVRCNQGCRIKDNNCNEQIRKRIQLI